MCSENILDQSGFKIDDNGVERQLLLSTAAAMNAITGRTIPLIDGVIRRVYHILINIPHKLLSASFVETMRGSSDSFLRR